MTNLYKIHTQWHSLRDLYSLVLNQVPVFQTHPFLLFRWWTRGNLGAVRLVSVPSTDHSQTVFFRITRHCVVAHTIYDDHFRYPVPSDQTLYLQKYLVPRFICTHPTWHRPPSKSSVSFSHWVSCLLSVSRVTGVVCRKGKSLWVGYFRSSDRIFLKN